ncbi:hypothetical protein [Bradyrhizobium sp. ORS 86]|uniref:hypothetical protein n=1 Tax=Bradyrhizobium sp. ORS 86 TaxID=1685970 RepID=UPI00388E0E81
MSDGEIEAALLSMPASPTDDEDVLERAALVRCQLDRRNTAAMQATQAPPASPATVEVIVPPELGATCIQSVDRRKYFYPRSTEDGRVVIDLPWDTFRKLAFATPGETNVSPANWLACNPHLVDRLPKNAPPPLADAPQPEVLSW